MSIAISPIKIPRSIKGITLIEVMVSILIFAVGVLGVAAIQTQSMRVSANASKLSVAVTQADNMANRMLMNPEGLGDGKYDSVSGAGADPSCGSACTAAQRATLDAYEWNTQNADVLHNGVGTVTRVAGTDLYTIELSWTERGKDSDEAKSFSVSFQPYIP